MAFAAARRRGPSRGISAAAVATLVLGAAALSALAVAALQSQPVYVLALAGAVGAIGIAVLNPVAMVGLGIVAIPLDGVLPVHRTSTALLLLAAIGWLLRWMSARPVVLPRHPGLVALGLYVAANAVGLIFAPEPLIVLRQVLTFGTMFLVAACVVQAAGRRELRQLLLACALCGGLAGAIAIVNPQPLVAAVFEGGDVTRATGGLGSPNVLGVLLALMLPVQIVFALRGTPLERLVGAVCAGLALIGMALAVSRGAFFGLAMALLVLSGWAPFRRLALVALPLIAGLAFVGKNPASEYVDGGEIVSRVTELGETGSHNPRLVLWRATPDLIWDHPIFGVGALEYGTYITSYGVLATEGIPTHAHSLLLTVAAETGAVGLFSLLAFFVLLAIALSRVIARGPPGDRGMAWALLASFTGFFFSGLLDYSLGAASIAGAFFGLSACAMALSRIAADERAQAAPESVSET